MMNQTLIKPADTTTPPATNRLIPVGEPHNATNHTLAEQDVSHRKQLEAEAKAREARVQRAAAARAMAEQAKYARD